MVMARAPRIERWNDGRKPPAAALIGELMTTQPISDAVVRAMLIGVPKLDKALLMGVQSFASANPAMVILIPSGASAAKSCLSGELGL